LDPANTKEVDSWTRFDMGARYTIDRGDRKPIVIRASIENVFDNAYWTSGGSQAYISDPRTFKLSLTYNF
jgi:iron complex outermembrane recepter protein